jgi:glycosyltransferase involved in cell wall biosynthesis
VNDDGRMRILIVGDYPDDPTLGSAKVAHKLRAEFRSLGHECDALFAGDLGPRPRGRHMRQALSPVLAFRACARAIEARDYDVVDIASAEGHWLRRFRWVEGFGHVAVVARSHGLEHLNYDRMLADAHAGLLRKPWSRRLWYPAVRLTQVAAAARVADRMIVLNTHDQNYVIQHGWKTASTVDLIPHGVPARFLEPIDLELPRGKGVLFCGTWDHVKGVSYLAGAWRLLADSGHQIPLTVLGPGVPAQQVLDSFSPASRPLVTVIPRSSEEQVFQAYRDRGIFVSTSTYEGFGMVVLEAMSQRLPVIATPVGCAASLIRDGDNGLLVPTRFAPGIAEAVVRLYNDPDQRRRLGNRAAASVAEMSWRKTAELTLQSYRFALARVRGWQ